MKDAFIYSVGIISIVSFIIWVILDMFKTATKKTWKDYINCESKTGTWDFFNLDGKLKLLYIKGEENYEGHTEIQMSEEEWLDLVDLVKRIA